jgi:ATP-dependent Zn protease
MKFTLAVIATLMISDHTTAFVPIHRNAYSNFNARTTLLDMPVPATTTTTITSDVPAVQPNTYGQPTDIRYSDFLKLVNANRIEKVTFSADGTQLLGVDADGTRLKIEALPNDPDFLTQLTSHKVSSSKKTELFWVVRYVAHYLLTRRSPILLFVVTR